jgi:lysophospholipase L1-like esterase
MPCSHNFRIVTAIRHFRLEILDFVRNIPEMKPLESNRYRNYFLTGGVIFYLASVVVTTALAQGPADVSQFPPLDKLPGKVPHQVWSGLAGKWAAHHAQWKNSASNDVGAVVFLGDSITEGWSTLAADFPKMHVANRGIGGDITSGVLYRLDDDVLSLKPKAIVLLIGTNDLGDGADAEDPAHNIQLILDAIKKYDPNLKVIVCTVMPRGDAQHAEYVEKIKKLNSLITQEVKDNPNVTICDTWTALADEGGLPKSEDFKPDHLHLIPAGYAVWKGALTPVLGKLDLDKN